MIPAITCECGSCSTCCQREYMRGWRDRNRDKVRESGRKTSRRPERQAKTRAWRARNRDKVRAGRFIQRRVASGQLKRQPCEVCGTENAHAHHDDYSRPLDVRWLCPIHHAEAHRLNPHPKRFNGELPPANTTKTHCPKGHPYSGENLRHREGGGRYCRTCRREQSRQRNRERAAKRRAEDPTMRKVAASNLEQQKMLGLRDRGVGFNEIAAQFGYSSGHSLRESMRAWKVAA